MVSDVERVLTEVLQNQASGEATAHSVRVNYVGYTHRTDRRRERRRRWQWHGK